MWNIPPNRCVGCPIHGPMPLCAKAPPGLRTRLTTGYQLVDDADHGQYDQDVDEAAYCCAETDETDEPSDNEKGDDDVEQVVHERGV